MITHTGGCHCGRVRFEVIAPARIEVTDCDCSICSKSGYLHLIVPKSRFKLLSGADALTTYEFNTKTAKHLFCSVCGIKAFYVPRSHPDGYSVNARCLDEGTVEHMTITRSDGKNWEKTYASGRGQAARVTGAAMELRMLESKDVAAFNALRLAALRECPTAFSSSYEEECDIPLARAAERMAPDRDHAIFGAFDGQDLVGTVGLQRERAASSRTKR